MPFDSGISVVRADTGCIAIPDVRADTGCIAIPDGRADTGVCPYGSTSKRLNADYCFSISMPSPASMHLRFILRRRMASSPSPKSQ